MGQRSSRFKEADTSPQSFTSLVEAHPHQVVVGVENVGGGKKKGRKEVTFKKKRRFGLWRWTSCWRAGQKNSRKTGSAQIEEEAQGTEAAAGPPGRIPGVQSFQQQIICSVENHNHQEPSTSDPEVLPAAEEHLAVHPDADVLQSLVCSDNVAQTPVDSASNWSAGITQTPVLHAVSNWSIGVSLTPVFTTSNWCADVTQTPVRTTSVWNFDTGLTPAYSMSDWSIDVTKTPVRTASNCSAVVSQTPVRTASDWRIDVGLTPARTVSNRSIEITQTPTCTASDCSANILLTPVCTMFDWSFDASLTPACTTPTRTPSNWSTGISQCPVHTESDWSFDVGLTPTRTASNWNIDVIQTLARTASDCSANVTQTPVRRTPSDSSIDVGQSLLSSTEVSVSPLPRQLENNEQKTLVINSRHYVIGDVLGEGTFGAVYDGSRLLDGFKVAVKIVTKTEDLEYISIQCHSEPLPLEVALLILANRGPSVPEIIQLLDWQDQHDCYFMVLEHPSPCEDLFAFAERHGGSIDEGLARVVMRQATQAAYMCCHRGVLHRDIKLENLLINKVTHEVKLIDFGCGDLLRESAYKTFNGTDQYCPPEYEEKGEYNGKPATVWSLGVLLFALVCGDYPNTDDLHMINASNYSKAGLSEECCHLISSCLQQEPEQRLLLSKILRHDWFKEALFPDYVHLSTTLLPNTSQLQEITATAFFFNI